jgi:hypothetical protein
MSKSVLVVTTRCTDPAREQEFNRWYDEQHIPAILSSRHFVAAQRYRLGGPASKSEPEATYLAIYEIDTDDVPAAMKALGESRATWPEAAKTIDTLQVFSATTYTAIGARQEASKALAGD